MVILDLSLPDSHGIQTIRRLRIHYPDAAVVVLSGLDDQVLAAQAVREGAQDYLVKGQADPEVLGRALRYAIERQRAESERARLMHEQGARAEAEAALQELSAREREVMALTAEGFSSREIGEKLFISPKTVDTYRARIMEKLGLNHRSELVRFALKTGLLKEV